MSAPHLSAIGSRFCRISRIKVSALPSCTQNRLRMQMEEKIHIRLRGILSKSYRTNVQGHLPCGKTSRDLPLDNQEPSPIQISKWSGCSGKGYMRQLLVFGRSHCRVQSLSIGMENNECWLEAVMTSQMPCWLNNGAEADTPEDRTTERPALRSARCTPPGHRRPAELRDEWSWPETDTAAGGHRPVWSRGLIVRQC